MQIFISLLFTLVSGAEKPELLIRADQFNPYKLPVRTKMPNMTPSCDESGKFSVSFWKVGSDTESAVRFFNGRDFVNSQFFDSGVSISNTYTNDYGVLFAANRRGKTEGAFFLTNSGLETLVVDPKNYERLIAISRPALINDKVLFRGLHFNGLRSLYLGAEKILDEVDNIAYIFLPTTKNNEFVFRVNYGVPGEVSASNPDEIFLYSKEKLKSVAKDAALDPKSDFLNFDSSSVPDGVGGALFVAQSKKYGRSLWHYDGVKNNLIYDESYGLGSLEYFRPAIGGGKIVFRLIKDKRRSVVLYDLKTKSFTTLMKQGDLVESPNEDNLRIIDREKWPSFSGEPCVDLKGRVYIHSVLESAKTQENKGSGIFRF